MALERDVELVLGEVLLLPDALFGHPDRDAGAPVLHRRRLGAETEEAPGRLALKGDRRPIGATGRGHIERDRALPLCGDGRPEAVGRGAIRPEASPGPSASLLLEGVVAEHELNGLRPSSR